MKKNAKKPTTKTIVIATVVLAIAIIGFVVIAKNWVIDPCTPPDCKNVDEETCHVMGCGPLTLWDKLFK